MDDLEFRRTIYADPYTNDEMVSKAASEDESKQQFWDELKQLDNKIHQASKVEIPEGLAHRLILRQSLASHQRDKTRNRIQLAMAASIAFVLGLSFTLFQQHPGFDISEYTLAHTHHEHRYLTTFDNDVSLQQVNAKLASYGGEFTEEFGRVYSANNCDYGDIDSFHLTVDGEKGKVIVYFIHSTDQDEMEAHFSDQKFNARAMSFGKANMMLVGEQDEPLSKLEDKLKKRLNFSA